MEAPEPERALRRVLPSGFAVLVPEIDVRDLAISLSFWCDIVGFRIAYARPEDGFAYLERDGAQVMLCLANGNWLTAPLDLPLGRGVNFQIMVDRLDPILERLANASWPLFRAAHEAWYRIGATQTGLRQVLVQDPDGYLLRFAESLGSRSLNPGGPVSSR